MPYYEVGLFLQSCWALFFEFNTRFEVDQCYELNTRLVQLLFILPMTIAID